MTEAILEKPVCTKCGADVRDGTSFCYACGTVIGEAPTALEEVISETVTEEEVEKSENTDHGATDAKSGKLALAAAERRKSRAGRRKPKKVVWEEPTPSSDRLFVVICLIIFAVAAFVVVFTVLIK